MDRSIVILIGGGLLAGIAVHTAVGISAANPVTGTFSFELLLRKYLREKQPHQILEWGPGKSTQIMVEEVPNAQVYTIEDNPSWASKWKSEFPANVQLIEIPLGSGYVQAPLTWNMQYNLIFVDGVRNTRNECLAVAHHLVSDDGVVILHDSDWREYDPGKSLFRIVEEERRTAVMVKS